MLDFICGRSSGSACSTAPASSTYRGLMPKSLAAWSLARPKNPGICALPFLWRPGAVPPCCRCLSLASECDRPPALAILWHCSGKLNSSLMRRSWHGRDRRVSDRVASAAFLCYASGQLHSERRRCEEHRPAEGLEGLVPYATNSSVQRRMRSGRTAGTFTSSSPSGTRGTLYWSRRSRLCTVRLIGNPHLYAS